MKYFYNWLESVYSVISDEFLPTDFNKSPNKSGKYF